MMSADRRLISVIRTAEGRTGACLESGAGNDGETGACRVYEIFGTLQEDE